MKWYCGIIVYLIVSTSQWMVDTNIDNRLLLVFPVYNFWLRIKGDESDVVYRRHVNMTINQIVETPKNANQVQNNNGWINDTPHFINIPAFEVYNVRHNTLAIPFHTKAFWRSSRFHTFHRNYMTWPWKTYGWNPSTSDSFHEWYPHFTVNGNIQRTDCKYIPTSYSPSIPQLSSDDFISNTDPCDRHLRSDYGMTMASGMSDILCAFCQVLKNMKCVWKFCSHPEGVYKIKYE